MKPWIAALLLTLVHAAASGRAGVPLRRRTLFADAPARAARWSKPPTRAALTATAEARRVAAEERRRGARWSAERVATEGGAARAGDRLAGAAKAASEPAKAKPQPGQAQGQEGQGLARLHRRRAEAGALKLSASHPAGGPEPAAGGISPTAFPWTPRAPGRPGCSSPGRPARTALLEVADAFGAALRVDLVISGPIEIAWLGHSGSRHRS